MEEEEKVEEENTDMVPTEIAEVMDQWDDELILKHLTSSELDVYVYQIPDKKGNMIKMITIEKKVHMNFLPLLMIQQMEIQALLM